MTVFRGMKNIWKSLYRKELISWKVVIKTRLVDNIRFDLDTKTRLKNGHI